MEREGGTDSLRCSIGCDVNWAEGVGIGVKAGARGMDTALGALANGAAVCGAVCATGADAAMDQERVEALGAGVGARVGSSADWEFGLGLV